MSGEYGGKIMSFGKYKGRFLCDVPDSYLHWCLGQDWFEEKYPVWIAPMEGELTWREEQDVTVED